LTAFRQDLRFAFSPEFPDMVEAARKAIDLIEAYRAEEAALSASYAPEVAKRLDLQSLQAEWAQAGTKFWFLATLAKRKVARQLTQAGGATAKVDPDADLPHLATMRVLLEQLDALTLKASAIPGWQALTTQRSDLEAAINRAEALKQAIAAEAETADDLIKLRSAVSTLVVDANDLLAPDGAIARGQRGCARHTARWMSLSLTSIGFAMRKPARNSRSFAPEQAPLSPRNCACMIGQTGNVLGTRRCS
jgi:hypothetical protein